MKRATYTHFLKVPQVHPHLFPSNKKNVFFIPPRIINKIDSRTVEHQKKTHPPEEITQLDRSSWIVRPSPSFSESELLAFGGKRKKHPESVTLRRLEGGPTSQKVRLMATRNPETENQLRIFFMMD